MTDTTAANSAWREGGKGKMRKSSGSGQKKILHWVWYLHTFISEQIRIEGSGQRQRKRDIESVVRAIR